MFMVLWSNWSTLIKKLVQTYIVIVSGTILNVSTDHFNGIWHLVWLYLSKPVLGGHPVLSEHYSIPQGCPLNTGFTVVESTSGHGEKNPGFWLAIWPGEMVPSCPLGIPRVGPARQSNVFDHILNPSLTKLVRSRVSLVDNWEATNFKKLRARKIKQNSKLSCRVRLRNLVVTYCYVFPLHEGIILKWAGGTTTINSKTQRKNTSNKFQCFVQIARTSWLMLTDWDSPRLLTVT